MSEIEQKVKTIVGLGRRRDFDDLDGQEDYENPDTDAETEF
jgi:hypothetical protein